MSKELSRRRTAAKVRTAKATRKFTGPSRGAASGKKPPEGTRPRRAPRPQSKDDADKHRAALALMLGIPKSRVTDALLRKHLRQIRDDAQADADWVGKYLARRAAKLISIGVTDPLGAQSYQEAEQRVLGDLYAELQRPRPSPTRLWQRSVQYALDARKSIEASISQMDVSEFKSVFKVAIYPAGQSKIRSLPCPGVVVDDPFAVRLLSLLRRRPAEYAAMMQLIETLHPSVVQMPEGVPQMAPSESLISVDVEACVVILAGRPYSVSDAGARFVKLLAGEPNNWFGPKEIACDDLLQGARLDRVLKGLPRPIRYLIEAKAGKGFRLVKSRLAELRQ